MNPIQTTDGFRNLLFDLYAAPELFVRELVQNAHDSIIIRQAREKNLYGKISVFYDTEKQSISFADNGDGMSREELENISSTIGPDGFRNFGRHMADAVSEDLIGQFGVGMFSAFAVGNRVVIETRKTDSSEGFRWTGDGLTEKTLCPIKRMQPGTTVTVFLKSSFAPLLDTAKLKTLLVRYCDYIGVPIYLQRRDESNGKLINAVNAPWDMSFSGANQAAQKERAYLDFVSRRFGDHPIAVYPFKIDTHENGLHCRAKGVLYIPSRRIKRLGRSMDVFIRRMLVKERDTTLLPPWAGFLRGALNTSDIAPNISRDNVSHRDGAFALLQCELEKVALSWIRDLGRDSPETLDVALHTHGSELKSLALSNDDFFDSVIQQLRFPVNSDELSLNEYFLRSSGQGERKRLCYYTRPMNAEYYERIARERGLVFIRATDSQDSELLKRYASRHSEITLECFDGENRRTLRELSLQEQQRFVALESHFASFLHKMLIEAEVRTVRFLTDSIPALVLESSDNDLDVDSLRSSKTGQKPKASVKQPITLLALNADCQTIQLLSKLAESSSQEQFFPKILSLLWHNALMYSGRVLDTKSRENLHNAVVDFLQSSLDSSSRDGEEHFEALKKLLQRNAICLADFQKQATRDMNALRMDIQSLTANLSKKTEPQLQASKHIIFFMITPFSDEYEPIRQAVKLVFANEPFCFEVRIATELYTDSNMWNNIRTHIDQAHGFVAEISEQNPNVMMELGVASVSGKGRFLFPLEINPPKRKPAADIKGQGLQIYRYSGNQAPPKDLAAQIQAYVYKDGKIINEQLKTLIHEHRKALFLSEALLIKKTRFKPAERAKILEALPSHTVEAFLEANPEELQKATGINGSLLDHARKSMAEVRKKCERYDGCHDMRRRKT